MNIYLIYLKYIRQIDDDIDVLHSTKRRLAIFFALHINSYCFCYFCFAQQMNERDCNLNASKHTIFMF